MLKKLTNREVNVEQREFSERTAAWCQPKCYTLCHGGHGDHYVEIVMDEEFA